MTATGMTASSRLTQRKPLGEINRTDSRNHGNANEPLRAKSSSVSSGKAAVGTKPQLQFQLSHRPRSHQSDKEPLSAKIIPVGREQV